MYGPSTRFLTILELLQTRGRATAGELARALEVEQRTVRRYVAALQDWGIPIESVRGPAGHYRLRPGRKLPPLVLDDEEALAVVMGLHLVRRLGFALGSPAATRALAKLERMLPTPVRDRVTAVEEAVTFNIPRYPAPAAGEVMLTLGRATEGRRRVALDYTEGEGTHAIEVEPYGLAYHAGLWYLAGRDCGTAATRVFLLERIGAVRERGGAFDRPADFDVLTFVLGALDTIPGLHTAYADAWRQVPPAFAALTEVPEGVLLRTAVHDLDWLAGVLAGLSCRWAIRRPAALRAAVRRKAAHLLALSLDVKP